MVMYFQDDFWEAVKDLPKEQRAAAVDALVAYHFTGEDKAEEPLAKAVLTVCKKRIDLSKTRQKSGKAGGESKQKGSKEEVKGKQNLTKTEAKPNQTQTSPSLSLSNSLPPSNSEERKGEKSKDSYDDDFIDAALDVFNDETKGDLVVIDDATKESLREIRQRGRTAEDLRAVVRHKWRQWHDDEMCNAWIRPSTLYSRQHFEEYLAEARRKAASGGSSHGKAYPDLMPCSCGGVMVRTATFKAGTNIPYYRCQQCGGQELYHD